MEKLMLGVAREVITPAVGGQLYGYGPDVFSTTVEDNLTVSAFYFQQGSSKAMMITATVCSVRTELADRLRHLISDKTGIPVSSILLCATHTHSGPNTTGSCGWGDIDQDYCNAVFIPKVVSAAEKALEHVVAVTMYAARGQSFVGINRRQLSKKGNYVTLGQNPWAPFNPYMTVLSFRDTENRTVANLIHYGCHGTSAGRNTEITRDWSGRMTDALEAATGGMTAFFNGTIGDTGPRLTNGKTVGDITYVRELGNRAAADALEIYTHAVEIPNAALSVNTFETAVPFRPRMDKEKAEEKLKDFYDKTVNFGGMIRNHLEGVLEAYEKGTPEETAFRFPQTIIRLGTFVFASFPFELFSEISMRIDSFFEKETILSLSNAQGSEGYFITEDAICRGGYEVDMYLYGHPQSFAENADFALITETVKAVRQLIKED